MDTRAREEARGSGTPSRRTEGAAPNRGDSRRRTFFRVGAALLATAIVTVAVVAWNHGDAGRDGDGTAIAPNAPTIPAVELAPQTETIPATTSRGISVYRLPDRRSAPRALAVSADGTVWFTEQSAGSIASLSPTDRTLTTYGPLEAGSAPFSIEIDDAGAVWATDFGLGRILRLNPETARLTRIPLPTIGTTTLDLAVGSSSIWFTDPVGGALGRLDLPPSTLPTLQPMPGRASAPYRIATLADGGAWFTDPSTDSLWHVDATGAAERHALAPGSGPYDVAVDPHGRVWVTEQGARGVAIVDPRGRAHRMSLPGAVAPGAIAIGPDGTVWIADAKADRVWRIAGSTVDVIRLPRGADAPDGITVAPDGNVWLAATDGGRILQIDPDVA